jgi:hypothetical protein
VYGTPWGVEFSIFSLSAPCSASRKRSRVHLHAIFFDVPIPFNSPPAKQSVPAAHTHPRHRRCCCCCAAARTSRIHPLPNFPHVSPSIAMPAHFFPRAFSQAINSMCYTCGLLNTANKLAVRPAMKYTFVRKMAASVWILHRRHTFRKHK